MQLIINNKEITAQPGQSLLDMVKQMGLITGKLSADPIAAKIAGETFTLNYIPLRQKDVQDERASIRKAMAASGGKVQLLYYQDPTGKDVYTRTAHFILFLAIRQLWPNARATMNCTVGAGLYIRVTGANWFSAAKVKALMNGRYNVSYSDINELALPVLRHRIKLTFEAVAERVGADEIVEMIVEELMVRNKLKEAAPKAEENTETEKKAKKFGRK